MQLLHERLEPVKTPASERVVVGSGAGQLLWFELSVDGSLRKQAALELGGCPSFLAMSGQKALAIDEHGSQLHFISLTGREPVLGASGPSGGSGPAYVGFDQTGRFALVANYRGGTVSVFEVGGDGRPLSVEQPGQHPHAIVCSPDNQHLLVPCLGSDRIAIFAFEPDTGQLTWRGACDVPRGAGPRHLTFATNGKLAYVTFEHTSQVGVFQWDAATGALGLASVVSTLAEGSRRAGNSAAHLALHPTGRALYASNRGDNSLAVFAIDAEGALKRHARLSTGLVPRHFSLNRQGDRLLVGNLEAASVTSLAVTEHGLCLTPLGVTSGVTQPFFVGFC